MMTYRVKFYNKIWNCWAFHWQIHLKREDAEKVCELLLKNQSHMVGKAKVVEREVETI